MEKRKLDIRNTNEIDKNKNGYTFVIPNSNLGEINIPYQKEKKEKVSSNN